MKQSITLLTFVFLILVFSANEVFAQRGSRGQETIEVRLASPLPRNSDWGRGLDRLASEWARVTNNQVRLRVIHDGVEGGESKMLSSLNSDNIQAGLFTSSGISEICPAVMTLSVPFMIRDNNELDLVLKDVLPALDAQLNSTNFVVVGWSKGGWINFFSKEPIFTPDDLRRQRLGTSPELRSINNVFRQMGFQANEADTMDLGTKLANNMINAIFLIPEAIAPLALHRHLTNMLDMPLAPVMGAIVVNRVTWNKLTPQQQADLIAVTQSIVTDFETTMLRTSSGAVTAMQRDGLKVNKLTQAQEDQWRAEVNRAMPLLLGNTFDRTLYNQINGILERSRSGR